jgi:hypothetical protein
MNKAKSHAEELKRLISEEEKKKRPRTSKPECLVSPVVVHSQFAITS